MWTRMRLLYQTINSLKTKSVGERSTQGGFRGEKIALNPGLRGPCLHSLICAFIHAYISWV